jgi:hypothetical protein
VLANDLAEVIGDLIGVARLGKLALEVVPDDETPGNADEGNALAPWNICGNAGAGIVGIGKAICCSGPAGIVEAGKNIDGVVQIPLAFAEVVEAHFIHRG